YIQQAIDPSQAKEDRFLREIYRDNPVARVEVEHPVQPIPHSQCDTAAMTKIINVQFASGSWGLDPNAKQILDDVSALRTFSNAYFCVEGNTDNVVSLSAIFLISERRAK